MKKYPSDQKLRWQTLNPLQGAPEPVEDYGDPDGGMYIISYVLVALVVAIVALVIYISTVPVDKLIGG